MPKKKQIRCEICGKVVEQWSLSKECVLHKCPKCYHIMRDLKICGADSVKKSATLYFGSIEVNLPEEKFDLIYAIR